MDKASRVVETRELFRERISETPKKKKKKKLLVDSGRPTKVLVEKVEKGRRGKGAF